MSENRRIRISVGGSYQMETLDKQFKPLLIFMRISGILPIRYSSKGKRFNCIKILERFLSHFLYNDIDACTKKMQLL